MLRIRLRRVGKKGNPSYRIVVADSAAPRDGKYLEWIGNYDPMANPPTISLKEERAVKWLGEGAQPSDAVKRILDKVGILERTLKFRTTASSSETETAPTSATMVRASVVELSGAVEDEVSADETPEKPPVGEESRDVPVEDVPDRPTDEATAAETISDEPPGDEAAAEVPSEPPEEAPDDEATEE